MKHFWVPAIRGTALVTALLLLNSNVRAQENAKSPASSGHDTEGAVRELQEQVRQLQTLVQEMRQESAESRAEMRQLRHDLEATRALMQQPAQPAAGPAVNADNTQNRSQEPTTAGSNEPNLEQRVEKLEESTSLMGSKIDEQYQTKVETASKYRARLHGIILMNAFRNVGGSDNMDLPTYAEPTFPAWPPTNMGATLRQSEIGLEVFGPTVAGARTSADIQMDFSGGFPATGNGVNFGIVRLQTASMRFDWEHTSIVAGQDQLFLSPQSPTSFASLATPTFAFAGNLWGWTPQLRVEHRFSLSDQQTFTVQAGILDNLDWENPDNSYYRSPQAGEWAGQPAYGLRTAWSVPVFGDHALTIGTAGYYSRQAWDWNHNIDGWGAMTDWQIPLAPRLTWSGEFYRGRAIGGLGGGIGVSVLYGGDPRDPATAVRGLDSEGGWTQLKLQVTPKIEVNGAIATDNAFAGDARGFATDQNNFGPILGRNEGALANVIFRPRSDLVLAAEGRRLRTFPVYGSPDIANQINLSVGILF